MLGLLWPCFRDPWVFPDEALSLPLPPPPNILWLLVSDVLHVSIGLCFPESQCESRGVFKPKGLNPVTRGTWEIYLGLQM